MGFFVTSWGFFVRDLAFLFRLLFIDRLYHVGILVVNINKKRVGEDSFSWFGYIFEKKG